MNAKDNNKALSATDLMSLIIVISSVANRKVK